MMNTGTWRLLIISAFSPSGVKMSCFSSPQDAEQEGRRPGRRRRGAGGRGSRVRLQEDGAAGEAGGAVRFVGLSSCSVSWCSNSRGPAAAAAMPAPMTTSAPSTTQAGDGVLGQVRPVGDEEADAQHERAERRWRRPTVVRASSVRNTRENETTRTRMPRAPKTGISIGYMQPVADLAVDLRRRRWPARTRPATIHSRPTIRPPSAPDHEQHRRGDEPDEQRRRTTARRRPASSEPGDGATTGPGRGRRRGPGARDRRRGGSRWRCRGRRGAADAATSTV